MKYLYYLLVLVLFLVAIFFIRGFITPSVSYESAVLVDKPIQEVWDVMSDPTKLPEWIEGFKRSELVSGNANEVGAVSHNYVDQGGQEMMMKETITKISPPNLITMDFSMDVMDMAYEMTLEEKDGKVLLTSKSKTIGNGVFYRSLFSWVGGGMKEQEDTNMAKLKKVIETNTKVYTTSPRAVEEAAAN